MAYMDVNLNAAAAADLLGASNTKIRVRIKDGQVQVRPTDRVSDKNLPKGEQLRNVGRKGKAARFGLPTAFTEKLAASELVGFLQAKHGWFTLAQGAHSVLDCKIVGRVTAK